MSETNTDLTQVRRPIHQAHGLPNAHYTDPQVYNEEKTALLASQWAGFAVAADVPDAGDA
ncbi:MAG: aromatic ring-hydroxylating dioxygenase subunit alpha, partial [Rhodobacteraceae bacterium]|nr:aromatic ring-hydroxylating dioxygenase subunit alpha [Paracoccaceae bacterium]